MADKKITDFPEISSIGANDVFLVGGTNATYKAKLEAVKNSIGAVSKAGDTMTGNLYAPYIAVKSDNYQVYSMTDSNGTELCHVRGEETNHNIAFREFTPGANGIFEDYYLPIPTNNNPATYDVLTSKSPVEVTQGGTGATDAATARTNLGITPANIGAMNRYVENIGAVSDASEVAAGLQNKIYLLPLLAYSVIPILMYYSGSSDSTFTNGTSYAGLLYNFDENGVFWTSSLTNNLGEMLLVSRSGSSANVSIKRVI